MIAGASKADTIVLMKVFALRLIDYDYFDWVINLIFVSWFLRYLLFVHLIERVPLFFINEAQSSFIFPLDRTGCMMAAIMHSFFAITLKSLIIIL